jgi:diguanylate cyclase (GGDEF)-like protein
VSVLLAGSSAGTPGGINGQASSLSVPFPTGRSAWSVWWVFVLVIAVHASGLVNQVLYPVVTFAACIPAYVGIRRFSPNNRWPWHMLIGVGLLWTTAALFRDATAATGNLSKTRSLWPDLFAVPGYVLFGIALLGLIRFEPKRNDPGIFIDAALIAVGSAAVTFSTVVAPTLGISGAWVPARLAVAIYPAMSMWLLIGTVQLVLTNSRRARGLLLIIAGTTFLQIGDVLFALGEIGRIQLPQNWLDVPYLAVAACLGSAALHPDVHNQIKSGVEEAEFKPMRLFALAVALVAPVAAIATGAGNAAREILLLLLTLTAVLAVARIAVAARSETLARSELIHRATHDQLTGLPTRELLLELATECLTNPDQRPVALMFLDLDEFKLINDTLGHAAGDLLLMKVGQRLAETVRNNDIVGRIGGDEFVIITIDLDADGARALADRIRQKMRSPFYLGTNETIVSTSIGITIAAPGASAAVMMQEADTAMYHAKRRGRNHVTVFDDSMSAKVQRRVEVEQGLRRALSNNEVSVAFQPIVDITSHHVDGFEALMRWSTSEGSYSPDYFMEVAEDSGLIVPLGEFVLNEACRQLAHWRSSVPGAAQLTMSVNVSARQVQTSNLVDVVANALETHRLPGDALWLELTESVMLDDTTTTMAVMNGLRTLGVKLALDDFGTGYSSLSYLRTFPMSCLKIDRTFISDIATDPTSEALVRAVLAIGDSLDLNVVAEGVETADQAQRLVDLGCTQVQGYLFSRPVAANDVPELIHRINTTPASALVTLPRSTRRANPRCRP